MGQTLFLAQVRVHLYLGGRDCRTHMQRHQSTYLLPRAQGVVMMVQNRYQRRRMYTRIALGKNRAMDVVSGESSGGSGQLLILYPMLFALQLLQCWIGAARDKP